MLTQRPRPQSHESLPARGHDLAVNHVEVAHHGGLEQEQRAELLYREGEESLHPHVGVAPCHPGRQVGTSELGHHGLVSVLLLWAGRMFEKVFDLHQRRGGPGVGVPLLLSHEDDEIELGCVPHVPR